MRYPVLTLRRLSKPLLRGAQTSGSPAGTCVIQMGIGGQKLSLGGLICPTGQGTSRLDAIRGQCLLLGSGWLTLHRLGAFIGTACFTFSICKEIQLSARPRLLYTLFHAQASL